MARQISLSELAQHKTKGDAWVLIGNDVYDVSKFAAMHPGGERVLLDSCGGDATDTFFGLHRSEILEKYARLRIGRLEGSGDEDDRAPNPGMISEVPYAEPSAWHGFPSPYYNESHHRFRAALRKFLHEEIREAAEAGELMGTAPTKEIFQKMGSIGLLAARVGPGEHLKWVPQLPGGIKPEEFDYFHECIAHQEVGRLACPGYNDGLGAGMVIGLPPVLQFGPQWMKEKIGREVLSGEKRICLAISEPTAGSDVANIQTTAVKTPCGKFYIVNGIKKWITNGTDCEYFVTAVRTGGPGMGGVSLLLIHREHGVRTKAIKTSYSSAAGTAYIIMEDVKVPVENLLGEENEGFVCIMYNFNHERWLIICYLMAGMRGVIEESFKWAMQRQVFGQPLIKQPVVRQKLAKMIAEMESVNSWLEQLTFQMTQMEYSEQAMKLAGPMSLLKYQSTRVAHIISDDTVQIFGGRGITQTGMGKMCERFNRTYKFGAILGGSEEIMAELGVRMAMKAFPAHAKL